MAAAVADPRAVQQILDAEDRIAKRNRELDEREAAHRERMLQSNFDQKFEGLRQLIEARASIPPPKSSMETITAALSPLVPVFTALVQGQAESRKDMMRMQDEAAKRQETLLTTLLTRQPASDPALADVRSELAAMRAAKSSDSGAVLVQNMAAAMSALTNTTMQLVHTAAEMQTGPVKPEESTGVKIFRELIKAIQVVGQSYTQAVTPGTQPALPAANGVTAQTKAALQVIEDVIRAKKAPPEQIAAAIIGALKKEEKSLVSALMAVGGDPAILLRQRLGDWINVPENQAFVAEILKQVEKQGVAAGLFSADASAPPKPTEVATEPPPLEPLPPQPPPAAA